MSKEMLEELARVDIRTVQKDTLVDMKDVTIDSRMCREERIADYIRQIKNPYCFKCNNIIVKINFSQQEGTLEDRLTDYFMSL